MEDYLNGINEDLWHLIETEPYRANFVVAVGSATQNERSAVGQLKKEANEKKYLSKLRRALPPVVYNYVRGCKTAEEIQNILKDKFQGNKRTDKEIGY